MDKEMSQQKGSYELHQKLLKDFEIAMCAEFPDLILIPITNGMFRDFDTATRIIRAGRVGVPDILILGPQTYIIFDGKTGKARFTPEQLNFKNVMEHINKRDVVFKLPDVQTGLQIIRDFRANRI